MTRIALLTHEFPPYPGGVGRYAAELARAAHRLGAEVTVLAPDYPDLPPAPEETGIVVERFRNHPRHIAPRHFLHLVARIRRLVGRQRFDIVHAADWSLLMALRFVATGDARRIATLHGTDVPILAQARRPRLFGSRGAVASMDEIVPNSLFTARRFAEHFPAYPAEAVTVAPLGVSAFWTTVPDREEVEATFARTKLATGRHTLVTVARVEPRKGHLQTARAIAALPPEARARIQYVTIGRIVDTAAFEALAAFAAEAGIDHRHLAGLTDAEVRAVLAGSDLFCLTAVRQPVSVEGFGLVLLEAASQGLPVLAGAVDAIPEVVAEGRSGWVVESDDIPAMAARIAATLAGDTLPRAACIAHARTFTWERTARLTYGL